MVRFFPFSPSVHLSDELECLLENLRFSRELSSTNESFISVSFMPEAMPNIISNSVDVRVSFFPATTKPDAPCHNYPVC